MHTFRNELGPVFVDLSEIVAVEPIYALDDHRPTCRLHLRGGSTVPVYGKSNELLQFLADADRHVAPAVEPSAMPVIRHRP